MQLGKMYRFTERTKQAFTKQATKRGWPLTFTVEVRLTKGQIREQYPLDACIVVLETHETTTSGKPLSGKTSQRLKVLLPSGTIGTMYVDTTEWEQVTE